MPTHNPGDFESRLKEIFEGRYRIEQELLGGGMSRVFLAEDVSLGRRIVLKILPPDIAADVNRDRFRREIGFAARLQHPHIVPLLAAGEEGGLLYYTMPFIDGLSLKATIAGGKQMRPSEVVSILIDVCDALQYAHREGVVHRDIKPANLLLKERHAVVTDFGVAKALTNARADVTGGGSDSSGAVSNGSMDFSNMTTTGQVFGTPAYMAPEQIAGDGAADHRVDIYAVGLLGYELLCGHAPFRGPSPQATIAAQLTKTPEPISSVRPDVPPMLAALISRCLEKEPRHRPNSADAVLEVLRTMDLASGTHPTGSRQTTKPWYVRGVGIAAAAVALIAVAAVAKTQFDKSTSPIIVGAVRPDSIAERAAAVARADSAKRAQASADSITVARAMRDSSAVLRKRFAQDSVRGAAGLAQMEQRLFAQLRDSVAANLRKSAADSTAKHQADLAQGLKMADSISKAVRGANFGGMGTNVRIPTASASQLSAEAFIARRANLGPARRIAIGLHSSTSKMPDIVIAASAMRDTIIASLRSQPRYIIVPQDSFVAAQQKSKTYDSLAVWLHADLFVVISATNVNATSDTVRWSFQLRDMSAYPSFSSRTVTGPRTAAHDGIPKDIGAMLSQLSLELRNMDTAPRATAKPG